MQKAPLRRGLFLRLKEEFTNPKSVNFAKMVRYSFSPTSSRLRAACLPLHGGTRWRSQL